ncbi:hypothetical protein ABT187_44920 [Streptomyces sp. NPDC001817]|uniref:hypothetical protein n=1 Tax=Streptomyces sp. NPDC001817 TaxID=3154398 RepID=UPI00332745A2
MDQGEIQEWNVDPGEGRIKNDRGGPLLYFTVDDLVIDPDEIHPGDTVSFQVDGPGHAAMVDKA